MQWGNYKYFHAPGVLSHQQALSFSLESSYGSLLPSGVRYLQAVTLNEYYDNLAEPMVLAFRGDEAIEIKLHWVVIAEPGRCRDYVPILAKCGFFMRR